VGDTDPIPSGKDGKGVKGDVKGRGGRSQKGKEPALPIKKLFPRPDQIEKKTIENLESSGIITKRDEPTSRVG